MIERGIYNSFKIDESWIRGSSFLSWTLISHNCELYMYIYTKTPMHRKKKWNRDLHNMLLDKNYLNGSFGTFELYMWQIKF